MAFDQLTLVPAAESVTLDVIGDLHLSLARISDGSN